MVKSIINTLILAVMAASPWYSFAQPKLTPQQVATLIDNTIKPVLEKQGIPGMAVAVIYDGKTHFFKTMAWRM